jgi:hypothetical protein
MVKLLRLATIGCAVVLNCQGAGLTSSALAQSLSQPQPQPQLKWQSAGECTAGVAVSIPMHVIAVGADHDPSGVWSDWDLWHPFAPRRTTIWEGRITTCVGTVIVSQIENRACEGPDSCPVRIVLVEGQETRRLLDYEQACMVHQTFILTSDGRTLIACDRQFPLDVQ